MDLATAGAALAHLLYALVGAVVLALGPRARANRAFALFSMGSGIAGVVGRVGEPWRIPPGVAEPLEAVLWALGAIGVVALASTFPAVLGPRDRRLKWAAVALGTLLGALLVVSWLREFPRDAHMAVAAFGLLMATSSASAVLLAGRAMRSPNQVTPHAAMALAVFAPTAIATGAWIGSGAGGRYVIMPIFAALCLGAVVATWLLLALRIPARRWPLAVCWIALGAALAGQVTSMAGGGSLIGWESTIVVVRLFAVAPLAFLIVRGQLPGLETKVRWTVSRGTVAATFIAAFFVMSEGAQIVFGQGNEWVGLVAAGALVFAIAPLQRAAERLAARAVPVAVGPPRAGVHPHADSYALAVRSVMATGPVTPEADRHLADLADKLGIGAGVALRLRQAVQEEVGGR